LNSSLYFPSNTITAFPFVSDTGFQSKCAFEGRAEVPHTGFPPATTVGTTVGALVGTLVGTVVGITVGSGTSVTTGVGVGVGKLLSITSFTNPKY